MTAGPARPEPRGQVDDAQVPVRGGVTSALVGAAGLTFLLKAGGGLYWMIPAVLADLVGGVINAWLFLVRVPARSERDGADSNP